MIGDQFAVNRIMAFKERLELCKRFNEGTETTDFILSLVEAADHTSRYGASYDAEIVLLIAERNIKEYIEWVFREGEYYDYQQLDADILRIYYGGCQKVLTEEQFNENWHRPRNTRTSGSS